MTYWPQIRTQNAINHARSAAVTKDDVIAKQRARIVELEQKCRWGADQFEQVAAAIEDHSTGAAYSIAVAATPQMDPDYTEGK
tara:strand:- start:2065 stop:2313 length:249 start_codon:yes stop_codon:yes gene_type:complete